MFKQNVGGFDRALRIVGGAFITSLYFVGPQAPMALMGLIPVAIGLIGWCPAYTPFGISTCSVSKK